MKTEPQKNEIVKPEPSTVSPEIISSIVLKGDLSGLTPPQKVEYYNAFCARLGLDPVTRPFLILKDPRSGRESMYADRGCAAQLNSLHKVSHKILSREKIEDCYIVTAQAVQPDGRQEESIGAVSAIGLKGVDLCNAMMKAETKAKRRSTLDLMGLGIPDESELDGIPKGQRTVEFAEDGTKTVSRVLDVTPPPAPATDTATAPLATPPGDKPKTIDKEAMKLANQLMNFCDAAEKPHSALVEFCRVNGLADVKNIIEIPLGILQKLNTPEWMAKLSEAWKAPASTPPSTETHRDPEGSQPDPEGFKIRGTLLKVEIKTGQKQNGTEWTRYGVCISDQWAGTFDKKLGVQAEALKGKNVEATCKEGDRKKAELLAIEEVK